MGYDNDQYLGPIFWDIETAPHPCAGTFIPAPDLDSIKAAGNLKDPAKIAEDIAKRKAAAVADHEQATARCGLDWNLSRIVALGYSYGEDVTVLLAHDEEEECVLLTQFWAAAKGRQYCGFASRTFDMPTCIQRSRLLGVDVPYVSLGRYGKGNVIDLRDILTFDDARYEAIMPRSLKCFARRFGIPVTDDVDGADIAALVAAGDLERVVAHVRSDVQLTMALAQPLLVLSAVAPRCPASGRADIVMDL